MGIYQVNQDFNNIRWGTAMPVPLMVGSEIIQIRARGTFSAVVVDPQIFEKNVPEADNANRWAANQVLTAFIDIIGESASAAADAAQLLAKTGEIGDKLKDKIETNLLTAGLKITLVILETIEKI